MDSFWFIAVALGPVILGVVIAYEMSRRRRLSARERDAQKKAVKELYRDEPGPT